MESIHIMKSSGVKVPFSEGKIRSSLEASGANTSLVNQIIATVKDELYDGISSKEIWTRAFNLLKKSKRHLASKYKLKKAIYELGPTGFPFEKFISKLLKYSGYSTETGRVFQGKCVSHEVDVLAKKKGKVILIECKFHGDAGLKCNVKIPLYINARYLDIKSNWDTYSTTIGQLSNGWVATNTRFTSDAIQYARCVNLYLLSWDYPKTDSIKDRVNRLGLYPITVSTLLTKKEKQFLLDKGIVLFRELLSHLFYLDQLGVSAIRKEKITKEIKLTCKC